MLFRLRHIRFFNAIARLARLGRPRGVETRRQPCTVYMGDRCKVRHYKGEVLITLISVLDVMPLAIIYIVTYMYSKWLKIKCYKREVSIALVLILDVMPLAIIYIVTCMYSKWLRVRCLIS